MTFVYSPPLTPYLSLLYVDDSVIVVDKPSGLLSVPGRIAAHQDAVVTRVSKVYPSATVVHRLDMATSGVMVLARSKAAHKHLSYQFEQRITQKRYYARLFGTPSTKQGVVDIPLNVDYPNRPKQKVDWEKGKPATTCYKLVQADSFGGLVELHPITGRSHQLRMHMRELGTPILGDRLYSPAKSIDAVERLQLHAQCLRFIHPLQMTYMTFTSKVPFSDFTPASLDQSYAEAKAMLKQTDNLVTE